MKDFKIRRAAAGDAAVLCELYRIIWRQEADSLGERLVSERSADEDTVSRWIAADPYFVVEKDGKIAAVLGCESRHGTLHLVHLATHPDYRRRGFARALMEYAEAYARRINAVKIWFDTSPALDASNQLYEALGYKKCGYLQKHYWGTDIVLYEKLL